MLLLILLLVSNTWIIYCKDYVGFGVELIVTLPDLGVGLVDLSTVEKDSMAFEIGVFIPPNTSLLERTYICSIEVDIEEHEQCIASSKYTLAHLQPGSHEFTITLKSYKDEAAYIAKDHILIAYAAVFIDTVDPTYIETMQESSRTVAILEADVTLSRFSYVYAFAGAAHYVPLLPSNLYNKAEIPRYSVPVVIKREIVRVVLFMTSVQHLSPSDRFQDWLCDHEEFFRQNYHLSVLTGTDGKLLKSYFILSLCWCWMFYLWYYFVAVEVTDVCGAPIVRHSCLSEQYARKNEHNADLFTQRAQQDGGQGVQALAAYLRQVDVVLVVNTYGDAQTSLLLHTIRHMHSDNYQLNTDGLPVSRLAQSLSVSKIPRVVMDLPNLGLPTKWNGLVDAFIAPSKFVAFNTQTTEHGK